jgi:hypothetical protein
VVVVVVAVVVVGRRRPFGSWFLETDSAVENSTSGLFEIRKE